MKEGNVRFVLSLPEAEIVAAKIKALHEGIDAAELVSRWIREFCARELEETLARRTAQESSKKKKGRPVNEFDFQRTGQRPRKRRASVWPIALFAALAIVGAVALLWPEVFDANRERITYENYSRIERGQSPADVEAILGKGIELHRVATPKGEALHLVWRRPGVTIYAIFSDGRLEGKSQEGLRPDASRP